MSSSSSSTALRSLLRWLMLGRPTFVASLLGIGAAAAATAAVWVGLTRAFTVVELRSKSCNVRETGTDPVAADARVDLSWFLNTLRLTGSSAVVEFRTRTPNDRVTGTDFVAAGPRVNLWRNSEILCFSDVPGLRYFLRLMGKMSSSIVVTLTALTVLTAVSNLTLLPLLPLLLRLRLTAFCFEAAFSGASM
jgi:hypothetical protein